jgi:hypothetical protein
MSCCADATSQHFDCQFWILRKSDTITKSVKSIIHGLGRLNLINITKLHWINFLFNLLQLKHDLLYMFFLYICVTNTRSMTVYHTFNITRQRHCVMFTDNSQLVQISFINCVHDFCMIYAFFYFFNFLSTYMANKYVYIPSKWQKLGSLNWCWWKRWKPSVSMSYSSWNSVKKLMEFYTCILKNLLVLQVIQQGWQILAKHWNGNHVVFHAINSPILIYFQYFCVDGFIWISVIAVISQSFI